MERWEQIIQSTLFGARLKICGVQINYKISVNASSPLERACRV